MVLVVLLNLPLLAQPEAKTEAKIRQMDGHAAKDSNGKVIAVFFVSISDAGLQDLDLSTLPHLKCLMLRSPFVTARSLGALRKIRPGALHDLVLSRVKLDDKNLAPLLKDQPSLRVLCLDEMEITDRTLTEVGKLERLLFLNLNSTKITDAGLKQLVPLQELIGLQVANTGVTDKGMSEIAKLSMLGSVVLKNTRVTGRGIRQLAGLQWLDAIDTSGTRVTREEKAALRKLLPGVEIK